MKELFNDEKIVGSPKLHFVKLAVMMMIVWLMLSGRLELKFLLYGVGTALIGAYLCMSLSYVTSPRTGKKYFIFGAPVFKMLGYFFWLMWQLILANIDVAKAIVSPEIIMEPKICRFQVDMDNPAALTILANSITLTPGTVTMNTTPDGYYEVHALTVGAAEGLLDGGMQKKVAQLFGDDEGFRVVEEVPAE